MTTPTTTTPAAPAPTTLRAGVATGIAAMACVGSSAAVSGALVTAPLLTAQALRYAAAWLLLAALARATRRPLARPRGAEWAWLLAVAATGMALFNLALVRGAAHAEPAVLGVAVACVPLLLAVLDPVLNRRRPTLRVVTAALVVTAGAALVQGAGHADATGLIWALVVLACEAAFTLLAVPVLGRLGPWSLSVHAIGLAAALLAGLGVAVDGPGAIWRLTTADLAAIGYLAAVVTALAFVLWYSAVTRLGPARAGLLSGVAPVAAAATGVVLGGPPPTPVVWLGIAVVAAGLALGLRPVRNASSRSSSPWSRRSMVTDDRRAGARCSDQLYRSTTVSPRSWSAGWGRAGGGAALVDRPGGAHGLAAVVGGLADGVGGHRGGEGEEHDDEDDPGGDRGPGADGRRDQQGGDAEEGRFAGRVELGVDVGQPQDAVDAERHHGQPEHDQGVGDPCAHRGGPSSGCSKGRRSPR
jgi:drug/metabolite transporter (DMT)-like permease